MGMSTVEQLREAALAYAAQGWRVFPCRNGGKEPATPRGFLDATCDRKQIESWWSSIPYNIGISTGPESGVFVVDIDPRNGGAWSAPAPTYEVSTGGGGVHIYYRWPAGVAKMRARYQQGIDIKGAGGYVIAPPSTTTGPYSVLVQGEPQDAPAELLAAVAIVEGAVPVAQRPGDRFNEETDWADILEPHGWTLLKEDDDYRYWTRPGKDTGISATTGIRNSRGDEADLFYPFTSSTDFEAMRGVDKFGAYAVLNFGGDIAAAAASIAEPAPRISGSGSLEGSRVSPPAPAAPPPYTPALWPDHFVSRYVEYAQQLTDAAPEYHEAAALAMLSAVTSTVRIDLAFAAGGLRTNLYTVLVGASSRSRKSTAQQIAASLMRDILPDAVLPDRMTGEAAISQLAARSHRPALWLPDEFGVMVQQIYTRDFMRPLEELLLTLYGGQTYRYVTVGDTKTVEDVHLTVFGAATPESFAGAGSRAMTSGLLPRFGVIYPAAPPTSRPPQASTDAHREMRTSLLASLRNVYMETGRPGGERNVTFTADALSVLASADMTYSKQPMTARLSTSAYKVAALIALGEGRWRVELADACAAVAITERWADGALRLRSHLARSAADVAFAESLDLARQELAAISAVKEVAGRRVLRLVDIARALNVEFTKLRRIQQTLEVTGEVIVVQDDGDTYWHVAI